MSAAEIRLNEFDKVWVYPDLDDGTITIGIDFDFGNASTTLTPRQVDDLVKALAEARTQVGGRP